MFFNNTKKMLHQTNLAMNRLAYADEKQAMEYSKLNEKIDEANEIEKAKIKAMDRVDITLEEYEAMKERIKQLKSDNDCMEAVLKRINFPLDVPIVPGSIETRVCENFNIDFMGNRFYKCMIHFDVDEFELRKWIHSPDCHPTGSDIFQILKERLN